jgi:tetratricopeptide (TPR) repeat protein
VQPSSSWAALLEGYAVECYTVGTGDEAVAAQQHAVALRRSLHDDAAVGSGLRWLSRMQWWNGDRPAAEASAREAVAVIEPLGDERLLALTYSNQVQLDMLAFRSASSIVTAERAVPLARRTGDDATLAHALNNLGSAHWHLGHREGRPLLEESLRVALAGGEIEHALRAYVNIAWFLLDQFHVDDAAPYIRHGTELAERAEYLGYLDYLSIMRGRLELERAEWDAAIRSATTGMQVRPTLRCPALTVIGRAHSRRGDDHGP